MQFIGVNWDHPSGASLFLNDIISASVSEERFSGIKNDVSFPMKSINFCMERAERPAKIDGVGIASLKVNYTSMLTHYVTNFSVADKIREQKEIWYPRLYKGEIVDFALTFKDKWIKEQYPEKYWADYDSSKIDSYSDDRVDIIADYVGISKEKVLLIEHHLCHAFYAYYASPFRNEKAIVITIDGMGDDLNATVSIGDGNKGIKRIYETNKCVLGRIYRHITLLLGMKPLEHEYKLMGLAPYVDSKHAAPAYNVFNEILKIDGMEFKWKNKPKDSYFHFQHRLEGIRFDNIAAGLQMWVEDTLCKWVTNIIKETKIDTIVLSGGVAMNVKAMGKIAQLPCVRQMFVPGTGSDDSCCLGAAIGAMDALNNGNMQITPVVDSLLLGPSVGDEEEVLMEAEHNSALIVDKKVKMEKIASLLGNGMVIGRCVGRMEFGQRALGNRSILGDPRNMDIVPRINMMIKNRDFWMPFAPVVLDTHVERYLVNPKKIHSPHMTIAYDTTPEGWKSLRAACHPADHTARPQILKSEENPVFYSLVRAFEELTGVGGLLNTSFNLHGYPIVNSARDAYEVFMKTGLNGLLLPGGLILKKQFASEGTLGTNSRSHTD